MIKDKKQPTIFIDIDGTLFSYQSTTEEILNKKQSLLPFVKEKMQDWWNKGYCIILTTARTEQDMGDITREQLKEFGINYHYLLMGVTSGVRYLINDEKPDIKQTAIGITIPRNAGLFNIEI